MSSIYSCQKQESTQLSFTMRTDSDTVIKWNILLNNEKELTTYSHNNMDECHRRNIEKKKTKDNILNYFTYMNSKTMNIR